MAGRTMASRVRKLLKERCRRCLMGNDVVWACKTCTRKWLCPHNHFPDGPAQREVLKHYATCQAQASAPRTCVDCRQSFASPGQHKRCNRCRYRRYGKCRAEFVMQESGQWTEFLPQQELAARQARIQAHAERVRREMTALGEVNQATCGQRWGPGCRKQPSTED